MKQISSVDLYYLLKELKIFEEQRIDNFYFENNTFFLRSYVKQKGHLYICNKVSEYIYFDDKKDDASEPNNFIQYLRKYLKNGIIQKIEQIENERIIRIVITKMENEKIVNYYLYLELFANGNIVICDNENKIKNSLEKRKFKDREVLVNRQYVLPPKKEFSLFNIEKNLIEQGFKDSDLSLVKFLAIKFGLGGKFAEEVCIRSNIDKNVLVNSISSSQIEIITTNLKNIINQDIDPYLLVKDDVIKDFFPFKFESVDSNNLVSKNSFNDCLKDYFSNFKQDIDLREKEFQKELKKLQTRLEKLDEQKNQILEDYDKYNDIGNKIYENYDTVNELLDSISKAGREKGWDYVNQIVNSNDKLKKLVKKVNPKNNEIILDL